MGEQVAVLRQEKEALVAENKVLHQSLQEKDEKLEALETRLEDLEGSLQRRTARNKQNRENNEKKVAKLQGNTLFKKPLEKWTQFSFTAANKKQEKVLKLLQEKHEELMKMFDRSKS